MPKVDTRLMKYGILYQRKYKPENSVNNFKNLLFKNKLKLCSCNLCKVYIADIGYLESV